MSKAKLLAIPAAAAMVGLSYVNYRRFMPAAKPLGEVSYKPVVTKHPIQVDGRTIYGELLTPEGVGGKLPIVILCHGFGSSYKLTKQAVGLPLAMSGYAAYAFDFCGGSTHSKSSGQFRDMTIFTEKQDLLDVIDHIRQLPMVDPDRIYLLGESQGGMICGITAPQVEDMIRAMVLYYPAFCIPDDSRAKFSSKEEIPDEVTAFKLKIGGDYYRSAYDFDVFQVLPGFAKPVLILHGDRDTVVPVIYGKRAAEVYPDAVFEILPGEIHGWYGKGKRKAAEKAFAFFEKEK